MAIPETSAHETTDGRPGRPALVGLYLVFFAIALMPVFAFEVLPLGDMLNHLTRAYIINTLDSSPDLQKYYAVHWALFSFQSTDLLLPPLARWFGLATSQHLFVAITFGLLLSGTAALHRALFGRIGPWPAAAVLFLYSFPLALGQISFLFSTGLSLLLLAGWIAYRDRLDTRRLMVFVLVSFALFLSHFFAFAAYALTVASYELGRLREEPTLARKLRRLIAVGLPLTAPAICFVLQFGGTIKGNTFYGEILAKAVAVLSPTLTYGTWSDILLTIAIGAALWILERKKLLSFAKTMRVPAIVLILTAIAMPRLLSGVLGADLRLPCLLAFLLVGSSELALPRRRAVAIFAAGLGALLVFRVASIFEQWRHFDADYREFRAVDDKIERGSRLVVIPFEKDFRSHPQPLLPYWFVTAFAVIDRDVFMPLLYTFATPLQLAGEGTEIVSGTLARARKVEWHPADPAFATADAATLAQTSAVGQRISDVDVYTSTIDWSDWPERFDYAVDLHFGRAGNPVPALLTEVWRGSYFTIYRIHPPGRS